MSDQKDIKADKERRTRLAIGILSTMTSAEIMGLANKRRAFDEEVVHHRQGLISEGFHDGHKQGYDECLRTNKLLQLDRKYVRRDGIAFGLLAGLTIGAALCFSAFVFGPTLIGFIVGM